MTLEWIAKKKAKLHEPHVAPLTDFVDQLKTQYPAKEIPYFDPDDGGIYARILLVKEAPGPTAIESGFVAPENKGQTAKNMRELREAALLDKRLVANWNIVPWYVGNADKNKIEPASKADVCEGVACLKLLLELLLELRVVILMGNKAKKGVVRWLPSDYRHLQILQTYHPSPVAVNAHEDRRQHILDTFRHAQHLATK